MKKYSLYRKVGVNAERDALLEKYPQCAEYGNFYLFAETHEQAFGVPASNITDYGETNLVGNAQDITSPNDVTQADFDVLLTATLAGGIPVGREVIFNRGTGRYFRDSRFPPQAE